MSRARPEGRARLERRGPPAASAAPRAGNPGCHPLRTEEAPVRVLRRVSRTLCDFDSSVAAVRAVSRFMRGRDFRALGAGPASARLAALASALPAGAQRRLFVTAGRFQSARASRVRGLTGEDLASWTAGQFLPPVVGDHDRGRPVITHGRPPRRGTRPARCAGAAACGRAARRAAAPARRAGPARPRGRGGPRRPGPVCGAERRAADGAVRR